MAVNFKAIKQWEAHFKSYFLMAVNFKAIKESEVHFTSHF